MLRMNKKVVSDEVTNEDIDPVLLLWDEKNETWYLQIKTSLFGLRQSDINNSFGY